MKELVCDKCGAKVPWAVGSFSSIFLPAGTLLLCPKCSAKDEEERGQTKQG